MESSHSLILNEEAFKLIPDHKKPVYVFEWLRYLDKGLVAAQKVSSLFQFGFFYQQNDSYLLFCMRACGSVYIV